MKQIFILLMLFSFAQSASAAPTTAGSCDITNLNSVFVGKGIVHGSKPGGNELQGEWFLEFDYVCKAWADSSDMRFATHGMHNSYGSVNAYRTNTWGIVGQAVLPRETVLAQNNFVLHKVNANEVDADGLVSGSVNIRMFEVDKNGTVGGGEGGRFDAGTYRNLRLLNKFNIIFSDGARNKNYKTVVGDYYMPVSVYVYNNACSLDYEPTINVGNIPAGQDRSVPFSIGLNCHDSVTVQNNISTVFSNNSSNSVSVDSSNKILNYVKDGVKVNLSIRSEDDIGIIFGDSYDFSVTDISDNSSYKMNYIGDFEALSDSNQGDFSFIVKFVLTYN